MYRITVCDYFSSAHQLRGYKGKCENLHGHNWKIEIEVQGTELDNVGMLIDFKIIKELLKDSLAHLDHKMLNDIPPFDKINPSSELLAKYLFEKISVILPVSIRLSHVSVWESENSKATYLPQ